MARNLQHTPSLFDPYTSLMGFLGGSLIACGVFGSLGLVIQAGLIVLGILTFLYAILPSGKEIYMLTAIFSFLVGFVAGFVTEGIGLGTPYSSIVFLAAVVAFTIRFILSEREIFR